MLTGPWRGRRFGRVATADEGWHTAPIVLGQCAVTLPDGSRRVVTLIPGEVAELR